MTVLVRDLRMILTEINQEQRNKQNDHKLEKNDSQKNQLRDNIKWGVNKNKNMKQSLNFHFEIVYRKVCKDTFQNIFIYLPEKSS